MSNRESEKAEDGETEIRTNERYNLQPRPKNRVQFALAQSDKQSIVLPKTHAHIMMTQLNIKVGIQAFCTKGNEAILKEIKQLHTLDKYLCHTAEMTCHMKKEKRPSDT